MCQGIPPYPDYKCCEPEVAESGTIFNVFSYDGVLGRDANLSHTSQRADALPVMTQSRVTSFSKSYRNILVIDKKKDIT